VFVGEDGPTHQPIEHLASFRAMPNVCVLRPADATETAAAWVVALERTDGPTLLCLTRQNLPVLDRSKLAPADGVKKGGYVLWESAAGSTPDLILMGTGSELHAAFEAGQAIAAKGKRVRVVSMPSCDLFAKQPADYRESVLPARATARVAVEAGVSLGWDRWVGPAGRIVSIEKFGASAPYKIVGEKYGMTTANVLSVAESLL
jgi:transketolase